MRFCSAAISAILARASVSIGWASAMLAARSMRSRSFCSSPPSAASRSRSVILEIMGELRADKGGISVQNGPLQSHPRNGLTTEGGGNRR